MLKIYTEGKAMFYASDCNNPSSKVPVFYNPVMKLSRDVAVWFVKNLKPKALCLGMEASGVRAVRMALESFPLSERRNGVSIALEAGAGNIIANDASRAAFEAMQKNIALNKVDGSVTLQNKDIKALLCEGSLYDYIDIDPFGTPVYYAENAIQSLNGNGILAVTATDTSCLCGRFAGACIKKYGSRPLNNEFSKETGLRILINALQAIGLRHGKALFPIFAHSSNHYMRAYLRYNTSESALREVEAGQGFVLYCRKCLNRHASQSKEGLCCGSRMEYAGLLWLGRLWGEHLLEDFSLIPYIREESRINAPWHFDVHRIAGLVKKEALKQDTVIHLLQEKGFKASRTHFKPEGIKTDASIADIASLF